MELKEKYAKTEKVIMKTKYFRQIGIFFFEEDFFKNTIKTTQVLMGFRHTTGLYNS
jgi:hypothetical protein